MLNFLPKHIMICDIESTHKIIACAEILTIAFIKCDLQLNVIERRSWKMAPTYWTPEHDEAVPMHGISREEAFRFPDKVEALREIFAWFKGEQFIFCGHFNRDMFGMTVSYDYALLKQEFLDRSGEAYFRFGRMFPTKYICSTHSIAERAFKKCLIDVPLVVKEGNKKASRDFGLKNLCRIMKVPLSNHHNAEADAEATYLLLKKFSEIMDIFEVITNDWRDENEHGNYSGKTGSTSGTEVHQLWRTSGELFSGNIGDVEG